MHGKVEHDLTVFREITIFFISSIFLSSSGQMCEFNMCYIWSCGTVFSPVPSGQETQHNHYSETKTYCSNLNCTDWVFFFLCLPMCSSDVQGFFLVLLWLHTSSDPCSNEGSVYVLELLAVSPLQSSSWMDVCTHEHEGREEEEVKKQMSKK